MILHIDTRGGSAAKDQTVIKVEIREKGKVISELSQENEYGSQVLLPLITKLLQAASCKLQDLEGIEVEIGPGSFTGLRVGVSVANALGFALGISVNGKKAETNLIY